MRRLEIYEPAMCCETGACGPQVDAELVRFAGDVTWLRQQGVEVERYNLAAHPAAFVREEAVREALAADSECLPLVLAEGELVSRGAYPSRAELAGFAGLAAEALAAGEETTPAGTEPSSCGPGCDCHGAPGGKRTQKAVSLVVLAVVVAILIHKGSAARQEVGAAPTAEPASFAAPAAAPGAASDATGSVAAEALKAEPLGSAPSEPAEPAQPAPPAAKATTDPEAGGTLGDELRSFNDLNTRAQAQDAVLIYLPGKDDQPVTPATRAAVRTARETIGKNSLAVGLYTLPTSSSDYAGLAAQLETPAVLVAVKGGGLAPVSGEVTEDKLLQAFVAATNAGGGCGTASSCGPSGCP